MRVITDLEICTWYEINQLEGIGSNVLLYFTQNEIPVSSYVSCYWRPKLI